MRVQLTKLLVENISCRNESKIRFDINGFSFSTNIIKLMYLLRVERMSNRDLVELAQKNVVDLREHNI